MNRTKCYLVGHMEHASDGRSWRNYVKANLELLGVTCFDPYNKPFIHDIPEDDAARKDLAAKMQNGDFESVHKHMSSVRRCDLGLCDRSDYIIANITPAVASWGSAEELYVSMRMKKPIFLSVDGPINTCPLWLMGCLPVKYIYSGVDKIVEMIRKIDSGEVRIDSERWRLLKPEYR